MTNQHGPDLQNKSRMKRSGPEQARSDLPPGGAQGQRFRPWSREDVLHCRLGAGLGIEKTRGCGGGTAGIRAGSPFPCPEMLPTPRPLPPPTRARSGRARSSGGRGAGPAPGLGSSQTHMETREEIKAHLTCKNTGPESAAAGEDAVGVAFFTGI